MFTGLVEEIGSVTQIVTGLRSEKISIKAQKVLIGTKIGDSICTNGVCLTVTNMKDDSFTLDVMPETMRVTGLGKLKIGSKVNLERALKLEDRLGGHMVAGHVDGIGLITKIVNEDNATWLSIEAKKEILKYVIYKGSIAIDGISLTVAFVDETIFKVSLIPLTKSETTLLSKKVGEEVNLECDMVGKYIEKFLLVHETDTKKPMNMDFLRENGFM